MRNFGKAILVASAALCLNLSAFSQNVSFSVQNVTVKEAMEQLKKTSGYSFVFSSSDVDTSKKVSVSGQNSSIQDIVKQILQGQNGLDYEIQGKKVIVKRQSVVTPALQNGRKVNVKGKVLDANGEPVIGAAVKEQGTTNGTITDFDGNFSLETNDGSTLEISYIGYRSQQLKALSGKLLAVTLHEDTEVLDEIVVVGYGVQKKSDVTGAMIRVDSDDLNSRPVANAFEAMQGKAAGVDIVSNERPGEIGTINVRGVRSLSASNTPLYVVDGIPLMSTSGIETINPQDIESIDVLKDASATAIYGSRGANGVILVTTKQGKEGRMSLNYSGTLTVEKLQDYSEMMNSAEYIEWRRWSYYYLNPEKYPRGDQPTKENDYEIFLGATDPTAWGNIERGWIGDTWDGSRVATTDWSDMVTQTGITHEHTLSASGGTEKLKGYASIGYLDNQGTVKGQSYTRYTTRLSVDMQPVKWFNRG